MAPPSLVFISPNINSEWGKQGLFVLLSSTRKLYDDSFIEKLLTIP
jgi:hypothetical protein